MFSTPLISRAVLCAVSGALLALPVMAQTFPATGATENAALAKTTAVAQMSSRAKEAIGEIEAAAGKPDKLFSTAVLKLVVNANDEKTSKEIADYLREKQSATALQIIDTAAQIKTTNTMSHSPFIQAGKADVALNPQDVIIAADLLTERKAAPELGKKGANDLTPPSLGEHVNEPKPEEDLDKDGKPKKKPPITIDIPEEKAL